MNILYNFFSNNFERSKEGIYILDKDDDYTKNFGKQWKDYNTTQIDSFNTTLISQKHFLKKIIFSEIEKLKGKNILEIGCGAGRFTEYLAPISNICVSIDLSSAIYYNVAKNSKNLFLIKADFLKLISKKKFDVVICRGVLQHTPNPFHSILKLYEFIDKKGVVFFDIYLTPKLDYFIQNIFFGDL